MVTEAKKVCAENDIKDLSSNQPCSGNITIHYSFDYTQQVHLPSNPLQPGPIYFLVPRKYGLFGVCCEGLPRQVNFLVDEAHLIITLQPKTGCPLKLSRAEPGQYLDGRPPGKTRLLLEEVLVRPAGGAHPVVCVGPNAPV